MHNDSHDETVTNIKTQYTVQTICFSHTTYEYTITFQVYRELPGRTLKLSNLWKLLRQFLQTTCP